MELVSDLETKAKALLKSWPWQLKDASELAARHPATLKVWSMALIGVTEDTPRSRACVALLHNAARFAVIPSYTGRLVDDMLQRYTELEIEDFPEDAIARIERSVEIPFVLKDE